MAGTWYYETKEKPLVRQGQGHYSCCYIHTNQEGNMVRQYELPGIKYRWAGPKVDTDMIITFTIMIIITCAGRQVLESESPPLP